MAEIRHAFSVPMAFHRAPDASGLNAELESLFTTLEREGTRHANPRPLVHRNGALFESSFQLFDRPEPCVQRLRDFCWSCVYGTVGELNGYGLADLQRLHMDCESWFHITRSGGYFGLHNHALHAWSGVYCVRHDEDDQAPSSGRLVFPHPNATAAMYMDMGLWKMSSPFGFSPLSLRLLPGQLVLFPSWLLHEVTPYEGSSARITVAFNCRFAWDGALPAA